MPSLTPLALVTGANKGIGLAIARGLCRQFSGDVMLTARDEARGRAAVEQLRAEGLSLRFHVLDIDDPQSIRALRDFLRQEYGGLDVLINNAAVYFKSLKDPTPLPVQAEVTLKTNFYGTRNVCSELLPLMKPRGRVVNISSMASIRALNHCSPELQQRFLSETITEQELVELINKFLEDSKNGVHQEEGWPENDAYGISKLAIAILSKILAKHLDENRRADQILINSCCPGFVRTDMTDLSGVLSPDEGARIPLHLALLPSDAEGPQGQFIMGKLIEKWVKNYLKNQGVVDFKYEVCWI